MRKTSQDGADSTSITSGIENEFKKTGAIIKTKRNSIKRKVQNFSHESDDAVIEPLLQKDKEKTDTSKQSAKHNLLSKAKTEANKETGTDKDKLIPNNNLQNTAISNASDVTDCMLPASFIKDNSVSNLTSASAPLHNHMNTNVFNNHNNSKDLAPKSQILVEIDVSKHVGYTPSPLIFTTAKIHTDGKAKHMEPVQMTPVPILSTIEVSVMKSGINKGEFSGPVSSSISTICTNIPNISTNNTGHDQTSLFKMSSNTPKPLECSGPKICNTSDKSFDLSASNTEIISNNNRNVLKNSHCEMKEGCSSTSLPTNPSTSHKITAIQSETKLVTVPLPITTVVSIDSGVLGQKFATTKENTCTSGHQEKIHLNKDVKQDSLDFQRSKAPGNVKLQSDAVNQSDKTSKDINTISITSTQLPPQEIVTEKDNSISKLKPSIASTSLGNEAKGKRSAEFEKSSVIVGNIISDSKLPKSSANKVPVSSAAPATIAITTCLETNRVSSAASEAKTTARNKSPVSINTSQITFPITTTIATNRTTAVLTNTSKNLSTSTAGNNLSACSATTTVAKKITSSSTTTVADNKTLASLSTFTTTNKTFTPITTIATANKVSAPTDMNMTVNKMSTLKSVPSVNAKTNSATLSTNTIKPVTATAMTEVGSIKSITTNTGTASNKPSSSTISSRSTNVSKVPTAITSFQPTTLVKSPIVSTAKSHNIKTITPVSVAISKDNSLKSSTSNQKPSSFKNNSINSVADTSPPTLASSSKSAAANQNDSKSSETNIEKKSSKA